MRFQTQGLALETRRWFNENMFTQTDHPGPAVQADLHVRTLHSKHPGEWLLQRIGAGESYTPVETVYQLAKAQGMTVLEAQTLGLPAVVANCGGPQEIIVDGITAGLSHSHPLFAG